LTPFRIKALEGLIGLIKSQIIDRLGLLEGGITDQKATEYQEYNNTNYCYILQFGKCPHKNLISEFKIYSYVNNSLYIKF